MPATTTDTLIFELKVKDSASKVFDAWEKRLKDLSKVAEETFKTFSEGGNFGDAMAKTTEEGVQKTKSALEKLKGIGANIFDGFVAAAKKAFDLVTELASKAFGLLKDAFVDTIKDAQSFEDAMIVARRTMSLTAEETDELKSELLDLSTELGGIKADTLGEVAGIAGTLGIRGVQNVSDFSEAIAKIEIATDLSAAAAAEKIPKILTIFKTSVDDMGRATKDFGNGLNILGNNMNATQSQILTVTQSIAPAAAAFGMTKDQMLAVAAATATVSTRFGTAGNAFTQVMTTMTTNYSKFAEILGLNSEELKKTIETNPVEALRMVVDEIRKISETQGIVDAQTALDELGFSGVKAGQFINALTATFDQVDKALELLGDEKERNNSLDQETEIAMGTLTKQWETFNNVIDNAQKVLGGPIINTLSAVLKEYINPLVKEMYEWVKSTEFLEEILPRALKNAEILFKNVLTQAAEFVRGIDWDNFFSRIGEGFTNLVDYINRIDWTQVIEGAKTAFNFIVETLPAVLEKIGSMTALLADAKDLLNLFKGAWELLNTVIEYTRQVTEPVFQLIVSGIQALTDETYTWGDAFKDVLDSVKVALKAINEGLTSFIDGLISGAVKAMEKIGELAMKIKDMIPFIKEADEEATGNSLFPDMVTWAGKATQSVSGVNDSIAMASRSLSSASNALNNASNAAANLSANATRAINAMNRPIPQPSYAPPSPRPSQPGRQPSSQPAQRRSTLDPSPSQGRSTTTNVIFQGTNVVDQSSQARFVRNVDQVQRQQQARIVRI